MNCQKRFTTYETIEQMPIMVIKKDGRRQLFDREKMMTGLQRACEKRPVPVKELDRLIKEIEMEIYNSLEQEVESEVIGELVMQKLKAIDEVAYVRFASVYRQFKDINTFRNELNRLLEK
jgi:transcriptional repressor NrdR